LTSEWRALIALHESVQKWSDEMKIGYARVSTSEQDLSGQLAALKEAGCERVYSEKKSGANGNRDALQRMLKEVQPGDIVVVTRLDRLARSVRDLLNILERFGQDEVGFVSLREKHIDTTSAGGRLVLNIMASIAEFERELIQARMAEGRKRATNNGVKFGPKFKLDTFQKREALARIEAGESQSLIARTYGVDRATISRLQKRTGM
jgi:DNA invertase Pin-like site-specific DNA recombinase